MKRVSRPHRIVLFDYSILGCDGAYGFQHEQVMEYSKWALTYPRDNLPALAGVAEKIYKVTGLPYIPGLWRQNLLKDML